METRKSQLKRATKVSTFLFDIFLSYFDFLLPQISGPGSSRMYGGQGKYESRLCY